MIKNIKLPESAYFYKLQRPLSNNIILNAFRKVSSQKKGKYVANVIRSKVDIDDREVVYSLCIFKLEQPPSFLILPDEKELKYSYILIIEYNGYLIVSKKNVSGFGKMIENYIESIDYNIMSKLLVSEGTNFEKLTMNNMDVSDNVIRKKNVEALDLKKSFSTFGSNRAIINNMRVKEDGERYTLGLNTSRINKLGSKIEYEDYFSWCIQILDKIERFEEKSNYIDHFAIPIKFEESINSLVPNNILILLSELSYEDTIDEIYFTLGERKKELNLRLIIEAFEKCLKIEPELVGTETVYYIRNSLDNTLRLKYNKRSITLASNKMMNLYLKFSDGTEMSLLKYINSRQDYIICFEDIDTVYRYKKLFRDSQLLGNLDSFLSVLLPFKDLESMVSEKGELNSSSTNFDGNCLFGFVENKLLNGMDYIICDDLGDEWADHIAIDKNNSIKYLHSKHNTLSFGASKFHEVVAQAQKNIGNMFPTKFDLERKISSWDKCYSNTRIPRIRKGNRDSLIDDFYNTCNLPNTQKEIYLVVDFISKKRVVEEVEKLKNIGKKPENETVQILWLISSLISSCLEAGVKVYITCIE